MLVMGELNKMNNDNDWVKRIINRENLMNNFAFIGIFIAYFERMRHTAKQNLSYLYIDDGANLLELDYSTYESDKFKQEVLPLQKKKYDAVFQWYVNNHAICADDLKCIKNALDRRNEITHHIDRFLLDGPRKEDYDLLGDIVRIYTQLDRWWINEVEIPTSPAENIERLGEYNPGDVFSNEALILGVIKEVAAGQNVEEYQQLLKQFEEEK